MTHWRTMDAGRKLDWMIAEELGWTNLKEWRYGRTVEIHGAPPDSDLRHATLPRYSTDLNAAIGLADSYFQLQTGITEQGIVWGATFGFGDENGGEADTPALAICRAWLAYKEAQERNEKGTG